MNILKLFLTILATTLALCWVLTFQNFLNPLMNLGLFAVGILGISMIGMAGIEELDEQ
ncbi:MAG: hypothetical protein SFY66_19335 [Oculatellaceae cyanobacterium bins.114]|nr:hypothetical protein [Oculatellaceae cyanobacterium bins.114]